MNSRPVTCLLAFALGTQAGPAAARDILPAVPTPEEAPIALLVDASSGQVLFARETERRFVPASITKVMTSYVAFELMHEGRIKPDQIFAMDAEAFRNWRRKGSTMFLGLGEPVSVDMLLHGITTVSANDGSIVLAKGVSGSVEGWVALMNVKARQLGMRDSHFGLPNGWMDEGRTYVSARDLALLGRTLVTRHKDLYHRYYGQRTFTFNGITQQNHDPITGVVPGADGIKTGFTEQAGYGFLGTAQRGGERLVMVVAGVDDGRTRRKAAQQFMEWGFAAFDRHVLLPDHARLGVAEVQGGASREVRLTTDEAVSALLPRGESAKFATVLHYAGPIEAPIRKGEQIAQLEVRINGKRSHWLPVVAAETVSRANIFQRLRNGLLGLLG